MKTKIKIAVIGLLLLTILLLSDCGTGHVTVGVGVYAPGAWGGPYGGGYYPPVGIGYPRY